MDDELALSPEALAALQEHLQEAKAKADEGPGVKEDWGLSQFWYDDATSDTLAAAAIKAANGKKIVCISSPTAFAGLERARERGEVKADQCLLLEYDNRFSMYGDRFVEYDFNDPLNIPKQFEHQFHVAIIDPPYLAEECLSRVAETVDFLLGDNGVKILSTGVIMGEHAERLMGLRMCNFEPTHSKKLGNTFGCYCNYPLEELKGFYEDKS